MPASSVSVAVASSSFRYPRPPIADGGVASADHPSPASADPDQTLASCAFAGIPAPNWHWLAFHAILFLHSTIEVDCASTAIDSIKKDSARVANQTDSCGSDLHTDLRLG